MCGYIIRNALEEAERTYIESLLNGIKPLVPYFFGVLVSALFGVLMFKFFRWLFRMLGCSNKQSKKSAEVLCNFSDVINDIEL